MRMMDKQAACQAVGRGVVPLGKRKQEQQQEVLKAGLPSCRGLFACCLLSWRQAAALLVLISLQAACIG